MLIIIALAVGVGVMLVLVLIAFAKLIALKAEFGEMAADLLVRKQRELTLANSESLDVLFAQLKTNLDKYEQQVQQATRVNGTLGTEMKTQIASLQRFADEARAYTAALIGGNKIQGNKGEEILMSLLEQSGLTRGVHYDAQIGTAEMGRPDVCLYDVRNHHEIFIDAKMNIKDYIDAYNLPDHRQVEKTRALKAHAWSIRRQISNLASKNYAETVKPKDGYENLPLVAMFCPFDTILESALKVDPSLLQYAFEKGIVLVTPLTLWGYLWLISWGWKRHQLERNYEEIQSLGREVVTALDALLNDLSIMGESLNRAQDAYDSLMARATSEKGSVSVRRVATRLLEYGVTPKSKLKQL